MAFIKEVQTILPDGRFVVTYGENEIATQNCELPDNIDSFESNAHAFLAGVAHARLTGLTNAQPVIGIGDSEEI
jgi:hypothetical protein